MAPANAPMGHLDALPNAPKLWQALAHPLVRPAVAKILQFLPERSSAAEALKIGPLSLSVLDSHLEHALGKGLNQGTSAVRCHVNQVSAKARPITDPAVGSTFRSRDHPGPKGLHGRRRSHCTSDCRHIMIYYALARLQHAVRGHARKGI